MDGDSASNNETNLMKNIVLLLYDLQKSLSPWHEVIFRHGWKQKKIPASRAD
jgi:hypothetical protein